MRIGGIIIFLYHWQKILASPALLRFLTARAATKDPFVYRLGLQVFILARRVRLPYGSPSFFKEMQAFHRKNSLRSELRSPEAFCFPKQPIT